MEEFTEEYSNLLLSKEWLVKVDNANSVPYLFKFAVSDKKNTCTILITDMKVVWTEVLTRNQAFRRWNQCNPALSSANNDESFSRLQSLIRDLHTPGIVSDANFEIVESRDADRTFELDCEKFKWLWDTFLLGPKTSADVISKHLILPLISLAHVSFYSADPVSELEERDLEKAVDKIGRTARRSLDIHVKQTLARPRIATTLQRISSLLGLAPVLPLIKSEAESPDLDRCLVALRAHTEDASRRVSVATEDHKPRESMRQTGPLRSPEPVGPSLGAKTIQPVSDAESATESDGDDGEDVPPSKSIGTASQGSSWKEEATSGTVPASEQPVSRHLSHGGSSDSEAPPAKKVNSKRKNISDSDTDSDSGTKGRSQGSQGASTGTRSVIGRGVRQPIKRGGRRF